jgi:hydroxypyruvate reductase
VRAAIEAVHAGRLVERALHDAEFLAHVRSAAAIDVIAAGKAAAVMAAAFASASSTPIRRILAIGPARPVASAPGVDAPLSRSLEATLPPGAEWIDAGHPHPTDGSLAGARRALAIADAAGDDDLLLVLLSGGGSALMALPAEGVTLQEKQQTARMLMEQGAGIHELNTVRKHLSLIKGGQLAGATRGRVLTLAVSDVVGDDLSVIASGPTVADDTTFAAALDVLAARGGHGRYPANVVERLRRGAAGQHPETPQTGDPRLARAAARVIGPQRGAIDGARRAAEALGYTVHVVTEPVTGEARVSAARHVEQLAGRIASLPKPLCVISAGETTVTVVGQGKGGRNQEFAFVMAEAIGRLGTSVVAASIGTDGIDGPTDAAGAIVDASTFARAHLAGIAEPDRYLEANDTYAFFDRLGDLIRTGPTSTNVGDLQVVLVGA